MVQDHWGSFDGKTLPSFSWCLGCILVIRFSFVCDHRPLCGNYEKVRFLFYVYFQEFWRSQQEDLASGWFIVCPNSLVFRITHIHIVATDMDNTFCVFLSIFHNCLLLVRGTDRTVCVFLLLFSSQIHVKLIGQVKFNLTYFIRTSVHTNGFPISIFLKLHMHVLYTYACYM